jgi:arylsulfatase A-like enzyme
LIRVPGGKPGICHEPVITCDLHPTVMELAGHPPPVHEDGMSLAPLMADPAAKLRRDTLYFHYPHYYATTTPVSAMRARDWKLLEYHEDGRLELYNLAADPTESRNLAASDPARANEMRGQLRSWRERVGAQMPEKNPAAPKPR